MSGPLFFAVLMVVVLAFGIAVFWQESKRMQQSTTIYGVEDSIDFVWEALGEDNHGLAKSDVRRILEWEMHYLQQPHLWEGEGAAVVGGEASAVYVQEQALATGYPYEPEQIYAVLDYQAAYLHAIGAIGNQASDE
ncbi:MAG: hypothetical protein M5U23_03670 [Acidimicrobiia bacterium]|nr:hypothetical protein [Acidimicrobiia bacterium]